MAKKLDPVGKKKTKKTSPPDNRTKSQILAATDKAQYETERAFAAEHVVQRLLEDEEFTFESPEGQDVLGSCELNGVEDDRDGQGCGGAWVSVRFYVPNLDIDTEIDDG